MRSFRDYLLTVHWLYSAPYQRLWVCATDALDAHSECWQKLPENRLEQVDTFEIVTIQVCAHQKNRIV